MYIRHCKQGVINHDYLLSILFHVHFQKKIFFQAFHQSVSCQLATDQEHVPDMLQMQE